MSPPAKTPFAPRFPAHLSKYVANPTNSSDAPYNTYTTAPAYNQGPTFAPVFAAGNSTPNPLLGSGELDDLTTPLPGGGGGGMNWARMNGEVGEDETYRFHVRVMVPCYKEPLEVVAATLTAAKGAALPEYTRRTVYLCESPLDVLHGSVGSESSISQAKPACLRDCSADFGTLLQRLSDMRPVS
jgi:hypothetical protein